MTFDALERSRAKGKPITLFKAVYGSATPITWTDSVVTETANVDGLGSLNYAPAPVQMEAVKSSGSLDRSELRIIVDESNAISTEFLNYPPPVPLSIVAYTGHRGDADWKLAFTGKVLSVSWESGDLVLACEPISSALRRPGLRRNYQYSCPYVLYRGLCTASKAAATAAKTVQAVSSTSITLSSGWEAPNTLTDYRGGTVEWTNADGNTEIRSILNPGATVITLSGIVRDLDPLDSVNMVLGCNRSEDHCRDLHNVIEAFGGWTFIPIDGPYEFNTFY